MDLRLGNKEKIMNIYKGKIYIRDGYISNDLFERDVEKEILRILKDGELLQILKDGKNK